MSYHRSHPSAGVVGDIVLGASAALGNEFDIGVVNPSTLVTTKLFRFIDSGVAVFAAGLTVSAFGVGVVHSSSAGVFSSSAVVTADIADGAVTGAKLDHTGFGTGQAYVWNGSAFAATTVLTSLSGAVTSVTAGTGLTGGGAGAVTLNVGANADGSIVVNADDIQVGVLATDAQHGVRGGGTLHAAVTNAAAGFAPAISAANRVLLSTSGTAAVWAQVADAQISGVDWSKVSGRPTTLSGYGITDAAATSTTFTAGAGMTGGGTLSAPRTFDVVAADGTIVVNADSIQVGSIGNANISAVAWSKVTGAPTTLAGYGITDAVPSGRTLTGSGAITVAGDNSPHDLSVNRTIAVATASTGAVGVVQLASDLAGTGAAPTVVGLTGASGIVAMHGAQLVWDAGTALSGVTIAQIYPADRSFAGSTAGHLSIHAQNNTGAAGTGGNLSLGAGTGNVSGKVSVFADSTASGDGICKIEVQSAGLMLLQTRQLTLWDNNAHPVAILTPVYNGQTELSFASTLTRFDLDFDDASVSDGSAASIHMTAQNNTGSGAAVGGSFFISSGSGVVNGGVELQVAGSTLIQLDGNGTLISGSSLKVSTMTLAFFSATPVVQPAEYTISHVTDTRVLDAALPTLSMLANVLGTLIKDLGPTWYNLVPIH